MYRGKFCRERKRYLVSLIFIPSTGSSEYDAMRWASYQEANADEECDYEYRKASGGFIFKSIVEPPIKWWLP